MAFSTRDARRQKISAELNDWCASAAPEDRRTLILRLSPHTDLDQLSTQLQDLGADILSLGQTVTVADAACQATRRISNLMGVVSIDAPTRLTPKKASTGELCDDS